MVTVGVRGLCRKKKRWLVVRHTTDRRDFWTLPGGRVEKETLTEAIQREIKEETHLTVTEAKLIALGELLTETRHVLDCFFAVKTTGTAKLGSDPEREGKKQKLTSLAWKSLEELQLLAQKNQFLPKEILPVIEGVEQGNEGFWDLGKYAS